MLVLNLISYRQFHRFLSIAVMILPDLNIKNIKYLGIEYKMVWLQLQSVI